MSARDLIARNVRLTVAYDGTDLHGFAESPGVATVMGILRGNIERIVRGPVELVGAGRTDAGVHAQGQVVSGSIPAGTDLRRLTHSLNRLCAPHVAVRGAAWADPDFSARFSATARTYRYRVWNDPAPHPLVARYTWHVPSPLGLGAMNTAAQALLGDHDFTSFCRRPKIAEGQPEPSMVRRVLAARWEREVGSPVTDATGPHEVGRTAAGGDGVVVFEVTATAFCHQMVRSIVGTLVDVGLGRRPADSLASVLAARDRAAAGRVAPPTGLVLWHVDYAGERWDA